MQAGARRPLERGAGGSAIWGAEAQFAVSTMEMGRPLQRLFSTFPDGWPGSGLLLLRVGAAIPLIYFGIAGTAESAEESVSVALRIVAAGGGLLLLLGLWTPIAGIAVAIAELWMVFPPHSTPQYDRWLHIMLVVLAAAVAMLGPGAWSVDARLFGRKRFEIDGRNRHHRPH